ncbi:MAG: ABC transporter ATP-binding protein [Micromonosporaceae bacterium]|nr:ABC transporter ATP-binding protein [Micromonosporaceae bacterium]
MAEAILTERLTKFYGRRRGLDGLDLELRPGEVFGYLGPNGAGKTTTIRLLLDIIRPTSGRARVLGCDPYQEGVALRRRIGYLPGDFAVDGRQSADDLLAFLGRLRGVPRRRVTDLADRLGLDLGARIRSLSKGNRQKVGLVQAFMHSPELLILDEPTSGLDPLIQREFVSMVGEAKDAGQTVFMSSHVMGEVQQTADRVGIIRAGRMVAVEQVEALRDRSMRRVEVHFEDPAAAGTLQAVPGVEDVSIEGSMVRCRLNGRPDAMIRALGQHSVTSLLVEEPDLEELFYAYYSDADADHAATGAKGSGHSA